MTKKRKEKKRRKKEEEVEEYDDEYDEEYEEPRFGWTDDIDLLYYEEPDWADSEFEEEEEEW